MLQRRQSVLSRPRLGSTRGARRAILSLPLLGIMLIAGPESAVATTKTAHHRQPMARPITSRHAVVPSPSHRHKSRTASRLAHHTQINWGQNLTAAFAHPKSHVLQPGKHALAARDPRAPRPKGIDHGTGARPQLHHTARPQAPAVRVPAQTLLGTFMVTCYDLYGTTANGAQAGPQSVAVDPGVIPMGTQIYVPGAGERTADDTGGAIIGDHIDIWEPNYGECADWGVRELPVYRLG